MHQLCSSGLLLRYCTRVGWRPCSGLTCNARGIASSVAVSSSSSADATVASAARLARAAEIRRRELLFRWLRRLVVPAFSLYGLFLLRPTEGHFLRYVAERRHLDTAFNAWFPPVASGSATEPPSARGAGKSAPADGAVIEGASISPHNAAAAVFRSERDRDWAAQHFKYKKGSEDEERVARKRLLFARDRVYFSDDTVVETIRSQSDQLEELCAQREHPPMHLLSEQLNIIAEESRRYAAAVAVNERMADNGGDASPPSRRSDEVAISSSCGATVSHLSVGVASSVAAPPPPPPPSVELQFRDHRFFATAVIYFRDRDHRLVRSMRFIGACGMIWKELV